MRRRLVGAGKPRCRAYTTVLGRRKLAVTLVPVPVPTASVFVVLRFQRSNRGFDSIGILFKRGEIPQHTGNSPGDLAGYGMGYSRGMSLTARNSLPRPTRLGRGSRHLRTAQGNNVPETIHVRVVLSFQQPTFQKFTVSSYSIGGNSARAAVTRPASQVRPTPLCANRGGRILLTELLLPRIARQGTVCLISMRG